MVRGEASPRLHSKSDSLRDTQLLQRIPPETRAPKRRWFVLGAVVVLVTVVAASVVLARVALHKPPATLPAVTEPEAPGLADVKLTKCATVTEFKSGAATLVVTNHTTELASYVVAVAFQSQDGRTQYDLATASALYLAPGQSTTIHAQGLTALPRGFACKAVTVSRATAE